MLKRFLYENMWSVAQVAISQRFDVIAQFTEFLKELKLTEGRNTGIPKIKRALKNNGSKEPKFETNETRDYFITTIFMHEGFENEIKERPTTHQDKILEFCKQPKTTKEIMAYLGLKD